MDFSTMVLTMYVAVEDSPENDERVLGIAVDQSIAAAEHGFNPWFTEHHFRGPWHSSPIQFASYIAPQIPPDRYLGFGVLSTPYYNPVRLVEGMNLLDQLTRGRTLYGLGSGFPGVEPGGMGVPDDYHGSGRAAEDTVEIMQRLWKFRTGDPDYSFETPTHRGTIRRRVTPAPHRRRHPIVIRTASRDASMQNAVRNGWPIFVGRSGGIADAAEQFRLYRDALYKANHPPEVVAECLRWCTVDWLSVVVADTDAEAQRRFEAGRGEAVAMRKTFAQRYNAIHGPLSRHAHARGGSAAAAFTAGGDMDDAIVGSPDTVAAQVQKLADAGINHLLVRFVGEWAGETRGISDASMKLFSREVMPRFLGAGALAAS